MKATSIIIAAVLTLSMNFLFAGNDGTALDNEFNPIQILAPCAPSEATFEDMTGASATFTLAPVTPGEADFSDAVPEMTIDFLSLAPTTPGEADFSDNEIPMNNVNLAPFTPAFADFTEAN